LILPKIRNVKQLTYCAEGEKNILQHAVSKRGKTECMQLIFDKLKSNLKEEYQSVLYSLMAGGGFDQSVFDECIAKDDKHWMSFLLKFLKDEQKDIALLAAAADDDNLTWVPMIMKTCDPKMDAKLRYQLISCTSEDGFNIYSRARYNDRRKPSEWILEQIQRNDDPILLQRNYYNEHGLSFMFYADYADLFERVFKKLSTPKLFEACCSMTFDRGTMLTGIEDAGPNDQAPLALVLIKFLEPAIRSLPVIKDANNVNFDYLFQMFMWAIKVGTDTSNLALLKLVMSKVDDSLHSKLFYNYERKNSWNVLETTITEERNKDVFKYLIANVEW